VFPRKKRLSRASFPSVLKAGRRFSSQHLSVVIPKKGGLPSEANGYAVVVSKKVARLSVKRHQIKRRVLAAIRTLPLPPALIVFPQSSVSSVSYQDIKTELAELLSKHNNS
jgi:ribonuclease P protein component